MEWLNLNLKTLNSPAYIMSSNAQKATWIALLAYCVGQENQGHIVSCKDWPAAAWRDLCRVDHDIIKKEATLWCWDGNDLAVLFYPIEQEDAMRQKRRVNKANVEKRWGRNTNGNTTQNTSGNTNGIPDVIRKGKEGKVMECNGSEGFSSMPSDLEVIEWAKKWPGEPASGAPVMDPEWVIKWLDRMHARPEPLRNWMAAIVAAWRNDFSKDWRSHAGFGKSGGRAKTGFDLKDQLTQLQNLINKHPGNPQSSAYDEDTTAQDREEYNEMCVKLADVERQIAMQK